MLKVGGDGWFADWRRVAGWCLLATGLAAAAAGLGLTRTATAASRGARRAPAHVAQGSCPWVNSRQSVARRVAEVMAHMTLSDEITLVEGHGTNNPYVFYEPPIPRLCIPQLGMEDGPNGVADQQTGVTQLPAGVALAATFNPRLAYRYGQVIGAEEWGKGAAVNLGPTVNIDRDPRWGRSFETYTEDPFLNQSLATSEIGGVQREREMAQVKHFDAYNQETNRNTDLDNVIVSTRALHEIYMPAFDAAIRQAKAASVMCAYSKVNGNYSCENRYLNNYTLRDLWDFPGFVTSDYAAIHDTTAALDGTDMEQPFNTYFGTSLQEAVVAGSIPRAVLNTMVARILTEMFRFNLFAAPPTGTTANTVTTPAHVALSNQVADAATTLLKNAGNTLPLSARSGGTIAVIGPAASTMPVNGGGGSAYVIPSGNVTPLQGIQAAATGDTVNYQQGLPDDTSLTPIPATDLSPAYTGTPYGGSYSGTLTAPETGTYVIAITNPCGCYTPTYVTLNGKEIIDDPSTPPVHTYSAAVDLTAGQTYPITISGASTNLAWATPSQLRPGLTDATNAAKSANAAVVVVYDDTESEATDRPSLNLPSAQDELIRDVAAANPHTIVVVDAGAPVAMPWLNAVSSVLDAWYPGQTNGKSLADVLFGAVNPGGHLPVTFPADLGQVPASTPDQFPGAPNGQVQYSEGIDVGYRWYDAKNLQPMFPFGFGLSYTTFSFKQLHVTPTVANGVQDVRVSAIVTNTGTRHGSEVAQLYLGDPASTGEPPRQLVGFRRVALSPGQSTEVHFTVTPRDTWWWDQGERGWSQTAGRYRVYVGDSSALTNLPLRGSFRLASTPGARQVRVLAPRQFRDGRYAVVRVELTAAGNETLHNVRLTLQLPQEWSAFAISSTRFATVRPNQTPTATFRVAPPSWLAASTAVVHARAKLGGDAERESGVTVNVVR